QPRIQISPNSLNRYMHEHNQQIEAIDIPMFPKIMQELTQYITFDQSTEEYIQGIYKTTRRNN
ncbi:11219_t:CDS:1, partial [Acaulospora colombiana]